MCEAGSIKWINDVFGDCIITTRDKWSFAVGLASTIIFLFSSFPQIIQNFRDKKVDGQNPFFFALLFTGSTLNFIGVLITHGLVTQIIQGIFYLACDGLLLGQFIVYKYIIKTNQDNDDSINECQDDSDKKSEKDSNIESSKETKLEEKEKDEKRTNGLAIAALITTASSTNWNEPYKKDQLVGSLFGWFATVIFTSSRIPQIIQNCKQGHVSDLSPYYFILSILGNLTYSVSILLRSLDNDYMWKQAPFLSGALGPLACDMAILLQMLIYRDYKVSKKNDCEDKYYKEDENSNNVEDNEKIL